MGAKKILFPLEMRNGEKVHTLEELKEKFDVGSVLEYADRGQLVRWLRDRKADDMAEKIESLDNASEEYAKEVCGIILGEVNGEVLRQIEEIKGRKEKVEKEKDEQKRREQMPALLVDNEGIYVVEGNQVKLCKKFSADVGYEGFGVVQEGMDVYYLERSVTAGVMGCFIHRINLETGEDEKICGTGEVSLCGVRRHRLFYTRELPTSRKYFEIVEMDLDTLEKQVHKIEVPLPCRPIYTWFPYEHVSNLHKIKDYPCIDEDGRHIYCEMTGRDYFGSYYADINLEEDKISMLGFPKIANTVLKNSGWGVGKCGFVVWEHDMRLFVKRKIEARCTYYDMEKKQMMQLSKLEKDISAFGAPYSICCDDGQIYWTKMKGHYGDMWTFVHEIVITEYNISTEKLTERVCLKEVDFGDEFNYKANNIPEVFVNDCYLYINHYADNKPLAAKVFGNDCYLYMKSWRFSLDSWKSERLVQDGESYKYVPVALHT